MRIDIITGFPDILSAPLSASMIGKGVKKGAVAFHIHNLRDFTHDAHRTIDDYPYGGGPGMVLKLEPIVECLQDIDKQAPLENAELLIPTPQGKTFVQGDATRLSLCPHLVFICGHYKGIDERIYELFPIKEFSIGDYILSAGEIATLVVVDAIVRLLPGVLKDIESAWTDSFSEELLDAPYYTRPENFEGHVVPSVLLSGNHKDIMAWKEKERINRTKKKRPDLYQKYIKS